MLKLRLKRIGRKRKPFYRLVVIDTRAPRDGRTIDEIGFYNPINKYFSFDISRVIKWLKVGVIPTKAVFILLNKIDILNLK